MNIAVTRALASHFFLRPAVVSAIVQYWMGHFGALDASSEAVTFFRQLMYAPTELLMRGQVAVYPTPDTPEPRPLYMIHFAPQTSDMSLAVPDEFLIETCGFKAIGTCLAAMAANPTAYWSNITHGGMGGHLVAEAFRWMKSFADLYHPIVFVLYALRFAITDWRHSLGILPDGDEDARLEHSLVQEAVALMRECSKVAAKNSLEEAVFHRFIPSLEICATTYQALALVTTNIERLDAYMTRLYARIQREEVAPFLPWGGRGDPDLMLMQCLPPEQDLFAWGM